MRILSFLIGIVLSEREGGRMRDWDSGFDLRGRLRGEELCGFLLMGLGHCHIPNALSDQLNNRISMLGCNFALGLGQCFPGPEAPLCSSSRYLFSYLPANSNLSNFEHEARKSEDLRFTKDVMGWADKSRSATFSPAVI